MAQPLPVIRPGDVLAKPDWPSGLQYPRVPGDQPVGDGRAPVLKVGQKPSRHPQHAELCQLWKFLEASYKGGCKYKEATDSNGQPIFIDHEQESKVGSNRRKRMATYRNFVKPVVDKFTSFVYGQHIPRDSSSLYAAWVDDVDGKGTCLHEFMRHVASKAILLGRWFVMVDTTKSSENITQAQAKAQGATMVLSCLHPSRIVDWNDNMDSVMIQQDVLTYILITDKSITTGTLDEKGEVAKVVEVPHTWGSCPVMIITAGEDCIGVAQDVAELGKSIFNMDALLKEELSKQTFTQYWATGISSEEDLGSVNVGSRKIICVNKPAQDVKIDKLSADPAQAESIRQTIEQDVREVYRVVGLRMPDILKQAESGVAIKLRFSETSAICQALSNGFKKAEDRVNEYFERAYGTYPQEPTYPDDFNEDDLQLELKMSLDLIGANVPPDVKAQKLINYVRQDFSDAEPTALDQMEATIRAFYAAPPAKDFEEREGEIIKAAEDKTDPGDGSDDPGVKGDGKYDPGEDGE